MINSINVTIGLTDPDSEYYIDLSLAVAAQTTEIDYVKSLKEGKMTDALATTDDDSADVSLANLN